MNIANAKARLKDMGYKVTKLRGTVNYKRAYKVSDTFGNDKIITDSQLIDLSNYGGFDLIESIDY